jgi:hypothetical protein
MLNCLFKCCHKYILVVLSLNLLVACGGGGDGNVCSYSQSFANSAPVITTNNDDYIYMQENQTIAFTVDATDADGDVINFTKNQNDDGGGYINGSTLYNNKTLIDIDKFTGVVTFNEVPDYENPVDANGDNIYKIYLSVNDDNDCNSTNIFNRIYKIFEIKVTNDPSDDDDEAWSPWDGNLILNNDYAPYDKHLTSYGIIVAGLPDVTEDFMEKVGNVLNKTLQRNSLTSDPDRNLLLGNIIYYQALQRVGSTGMSSYDPPLDETNYPGWDNINDNYEVIDFIWEATQNSSEDEKTNAAQVNAIIKPLLHTITLILEKSFTAWSYEDPSSELVLAMNEAINGGYYDPTGKFGDLSETDPTAYKRAIAQDFAYWMILTAWDLKSYYETVNSSELTIQNRKEMESATPLAHRFFLDYVDPILANPKRSLDSLTF